ncbi:hypothetical protein K458DRAFT_419807 [Lentithecium fluviatile CBS 122367]|uniref:Uncharacterized protein n=1 Tax=Lentithecium fluviatile CBS 122367 TaxID=1168545 RepID=A0A6G1IWS8_9PLEO|nr:hypothetical protein K458DRAFT_419807 [Lentithecium fluviatile CBS 122367]
MAGTRHRSRAGDAPAASVTHEMDSGEDTEVLEVPESVDNDSPRPASPISRSTKAFCKRCGGEVGDFFNSWIKVTNSYSLPALLGSYSSRLKEQGRLRTASIGTELNGCVIQPLACPNSACSDTLGIHVVDASEEKQSFRGRDFFKLPKIQLQCEEAPNTFVTTEPLYAAPGLLPVEDSPEPGHVEPALDMEVDSRPAPQLPGPMHHYKHRDLPHQPLQQIESHRPSLPPPTSRSPPTPLPSNVSQKSPSNPPLPSPAVQPVQPAREAHHVLPPPRELIASPAHRVRELPAPLMSHPHSPVEHRPKEQNYPRSPHDVQLDAIERLQTQISQNSSALVAQSREMRRYEETMQHNEDSLRQEFRTQIHHQSAEIRRVDDAVGQLQHEMRGIRELLEVLRREFHASGGAQGRAPAAAPSAQDSALELMAQQIAVISAKANDVETLKITIEIMKNKIQRLESTAVASPAQAAARAYASPREPAPRSLPSQHAISSHHHTPSVPSHTSTHASPQVQAIQKAPSYDSHSLSNSRSVMVTPESSQRIEAPSEHRPTPSGWATVNAGMKRTLSGGLNSPQDSIGPAPESPKRPKLAPIEPRAAYTGSQSHPQHPYEHMDTDDSDAARMQTHRHTLPSQAQSAMSVPESTLASQHSHASLVAYGTQDAPSDDSWRPESQRIVQVRTPRGRGSRGGPGSRGGRVRKSMAAQVHPLGTPEWERVDWQGVPESQVSPDGYYTVVRTNRPIIRRGSGGGGGSRGGRPSSANGRAPSVSLGLQGVTAGGIGLPADPYAHTKKTRTKPIRNADGVLIRKDGRPDMRSQSSAANLRKVHSRKEDSENPEGHERDFTPSQPQYTPNGSVETPSPTAGTPAGQDVNSSVRKKHNNVMSKMFPGGVDESRKELDYAHKVFEENGDHIAHSTNQHLHHHHHGPAARPLEIKREQESPRSQDVDMDRPEDHADDEGDNSGQETQYHETVNGEVQPVPQEQQREPAPAPAPAANSVVESSATLPAGSTHTLAASPAQEA